MTSNTRTATTRTSRTPTTSTGGAFKFLERPAPGNHEFYDNHGQTGVRGLGYFDYFDYFNGIQHNSDGSEVDDTVIMLVLAPDGYRWDYRSALESPTAPTGTPATYSDSGSARCN